MPIFSKILIANRGEIAVRVIRACRELGIQTVAIYSDADTHAMHTRLADEAVRIGPAAAAESYLVHKAIIEAALQTGAVAVHPGYGFLSENADFAKSVSAAGLVFIGPPAAAIEAMGDKAQARNLMQSSGVPIVPGYQGEDQDDLLLQQAEYIGFPVLVKAAAGGGGKGMRIVDSPVDFQEAVSAARREAEHAFGNRRLILEKYILNARHIEFQVLADQQGRVIHLFERECSVQRRHQKIIEETPSPLITEKLRREMGAAAIAAAAAVGYQNAGTVEFVVDPVTRAYYFLEMNTRLQVEHPITEMITGIDLVHWQLRIAAGELLPPDFPPHLPQGHALECRVYAEDPAAGFLPAAGPVLKFIQPNGPGVRVDTGISSSDLVSTHYDPMIAKIIVHAEDRESAIRRMKAALRDTVLLGLDTNLEFLQTVLTHPEFLKGNVTTRFIEDQLADWQPEPDVPVEVLLAAALMNRTHAEASGLPKKTYNPWSALSDFRVGGKR